MKWQLLSAEPNELGESPFWHPAERMLYWIDIPARQILRLGAGGGAAQCWAMPMEPGCIAPAAGGGLVVALRDGIYRARTWGADLQLLRACDHDPKTTRFNDGKADPLGRFWAATIFEPRSAALAELVALDCRAAGAPAMQRMAGDATVGNGLGWSPDCKTVYWSDTSAHAIRAWDWDAAANTLSGERVFQRFAPKPAGWQSGMQGYGGRPDGAAVDVQGNYYAAMFEGKRSSSRPTASCWPRSPPRRNARRCRASAAMTCKPSTSRPRATTGPPRSLSGCRCRAACFQPVWMYRVCRSTSSVISGPAGPRVPGLRRQGQALP